MELQLGYLVLPTTQAKNKQKQNTFLPTPPLPKKNNLDTGVAPIEWCILFDHTWMGGSLIHSTIYTFLGGGKQYVFNICRNHWYV